MENTPRHRRYRDAEEVGGMIRRTARALTRRAAVGQLDAVEQLHLLRDVLDAELGNAARAANAHGYSWADIGAVTGTTRQNARQRWATVPAEVEQ